MMNVSNVSRQLVSLVGALFVTVVLVASATPVLPIA
jgi:hypothetical protein